MVIGLSGGIENEEVAAAGVKVVLLLFTEVLLLVVWKLDEDVGVMGRDPKPPMLLLESAAVAPNMLGVAGFKTGVVEPKDMGLLAAFGRAAVYVI